MGLTWGYTIASFVQAAIFWRMSAAAVAPIPLFLIASAAIVVNLLATVSSLNFWWSAFALNRLFDLMLLYVAACALYRIVRTRHKNKGAPLARPQSSAIFAAA
jgi:nitrogen fixation/metabolism regulation signal transduction histidine kinase